MRISDWSSDVCSSDLSIGVGLLLARLEERYQSRQIVGERPIRVVPRMRSDDVAVPAIVDAGGVGSLLEAQVRHMQPRLQGHGADQRGTRQIGTARQPGAGVMAHTGVDQISDVTTQFARSPV